MHIASQIPDVLTSKVTLSSGATRRDYPLGRLGRPPRAGRARPGARGLSFASVCAEFSASRRSRQCAVRRMANRQQGMVTKTKQVCRRDAHRRCCRRVAYTGVEGSLLHLAPPANRAGTSGWVQPASLPLSKMAHSGSRVRDSLLGMRPDNVPAAGAKRLANVACKKSTHWRWYKSRKPALPELHLISRNTPQQGNLEATPTCDLYSQVWQRARSPVEASASTPTPRRSERGAHRPPTATTSTNGRRALAQHLTCCCKRVQLRHAER